MKTKTIKNRKYIYSSMCILDNGSLTGTAFYPQTSCSVITVTDRCHVAFIWSLWISRTLNCNFGESWCILFEDVRTHQPIWARCSASKWTLELFYSAEKVIRLWINSAAGNEPETLCILGCTGFFCRCPLWIFGLIIKKGKIMYTLCVLFLTKYFYIYKVLRS